MTTSIAIPTALRPYTAGQATVNVAGATVDAALQALTTEHSGLARHLRDDAGKIRSFVNVYLNDEDIRFLDNGADTELGEGDTLIIVPSIAGGSR